VAHARQILDQSNAKPCRFVPAGPERTAWVELDDELPGLRLVTLPALPNHQAGTDPTGLEELLPDVAPLGLVTEPRRDAQPGEPPVPLRDARLRLLRPHVRHELDPIERRRAHEGLPVADLDAIAQVRHERRYGLREVGRRLDDELREAIVGHPGS